MASSSTLPALLTEQLRAHPLDSRVDVLGVPVSPVDLGLTIQCFKEWIDARQRQYVCVTGVHGIMESVGDKSLAEIHRRAGLVVPDGMPLVWLSRRAGFSRCEPVYGPDLLLEVCRVSIDYGWRHYFYGGGLGVAARLARHLRWSLPELAVAGCESPPFLPLTPQQGEAAAARINNSGADIVWVGLGTPKQERWMASRRQHLSPPVLVGVGTAFDFLADLKAQAPAWMQRCGLEWLFRMATEPRRLAPRYLRTNPRFVCHVLPRLLKPGWPPVESS